MIRRIALFVLLLAAPATANAMQTPIFALSNGAPSNSATRYFPISATQNFLFTGTEANTQQPIPAAGVIRALRVAFQSAPGASKTLTVTLMVNASASSLTCAVTGASTLTCQDMQHAVTVAAGDLLDYKVVPTSTPTVSIMSACVIFEGSDPTLSVILRAGHSAASQTVSNNSSIMGSSSNSALTTSRKSVMPTAGTFSKMYVRLVTAPGAGTSYTYTLQLNGSTTALTAQVSGTNVVNNDTTHSVGVVAGDLVAWQIDPAGTTPASSVYFIGAVFTPTIPGLAVLTSTKGVLSNSADNYHDLTGSSTPTATESTFQMVAPDMVFSNLTIALGASPGTSKSYLFGLRVNGNTSNLAVTLSGSSTTATSTVKVNTSALDLVDVISSPTNTPTSNGSTYSYALTVQVMPTTCFDGTLYDATLY